MISLKELFTNIFTILRSVWIVGLQSFSKRETRLYPYSKLNIAPRFRGRIVLTRDNNGDERCVACGLCAVVCPVDCISLQKSENKKRWYPKFFRINFSRCIFCGLCEEACPTTAIQLTTDFEMSEFKRKDLVYEKNDLLISGPGKYINYNFYNISGVKLHNTDKKIYNNSKLVDVKKITP